MIPSADPQVGCMMMSVMQQSRGATTPNSTSSQQSQLQLPQTRSSSIRASELSTKGGEEETAKVKLRSDSVSTINGQCLAWVPLISLLLLSRTQQESNPWEKAEHSIPHAVRTLFRVRTFGPAFLPVVDSILGGATN